MGTEEATARIDAWIWAVRLIKTRSAAGAACRAGHVKLNGASAKPAQHVKPGDDVRVRVEGRERVVQVVRVIAKRVGAPVAETCYVDHSPPPPPREERIGIVVRDRGAGRPTKRDRRETDRLFGRGAGRPGSA
ncbi:S4 domain-containing protein [Kitasatospora sp. NPDC049285]|uniref:RNA-binding S4 domain-containing protein n=1 Tax=Kitasatospora sp. NPDC049285 TaxID=3157096 RepID=UPI0034253C79